MVSSSLVLEKHEEDDALVFNATGSLACGDEDRYAMVLTSCRQKERSRIILDLSGLKYISSAGLGMLLLANGCALETGCEFIVRNPKGPVLNMLNLVHFDQIMKIAEYPVMQQA